VVTGDLGIDHGGVKAPFGNRLGARLEPGLDGVDFGAGVIFNDFDGFLEKIYYRIKSI
jgi:hypothetical protein